MREEFEAVGAAFDGRGRRTEEMLDILELLWSGETVEYRGEFHSFGPVHFAGAPSTPLPLVFGGHGRPALHRAALRGSGWFGPNVDLATSLELIEVIEAERRRLGRTGEFTHYVRLFGDLTPENVGRYADAGVDHLVFSPFTRPDLAPGPAGRLTALETVAADLGVGTGSG
jgi:alkanesulfonate monooxygenase SsuD/methylene tetrahydromethanopterin reductase-like flavin-dependent oxidoreductase (luciferase family)